MFTNHTFKCAVITQVAPCVVSERQSAAKARSIFLCEFLSSVGTNGTPLHDNVSPVLGLLAAYSGDKSFQ